MNVSAVIAQPNRWRQQRRTSHRLTGWARQHRYNCPCHRSRPLGDHQNRRVDNSNWSMFDSENHMSVWRDCLVVSCLLKIQWFARFCDNRSVYLCRVSSNPLRSPWVSDLAVYPVRNWHPCDCCIRNIWWRHLEMETNFTFLVFIYKVVLCVHNFVSLKFIS